MTNKEAIAIIQVEGEGDLVQCGRSKDGKN